MRTFLVIIGWLLSSTVALAQSSDLPQILTRGQIRFAFYNDFPPFSDDNKGIDVELAAALAAKLGVKMVPLWFDADENMEDDLRNMVWKGHYLGYGPADAMMHVPVDRDYMLKNDKVKFFSPYYRERFAIARRVDRVPALESMEPFEKETIGVEGGSMPHTVLLSTDAGKYRANVVQFKSAMDAVRALRAGEVAAVMAQQGELEGGLKDSSGFAISEAPIGGVKFRNWALGIAVKAGHEELAQALQKAMNELTADGTVAQIFAKYGVQYRGP